MKYLIIGNGVAGTEAALSIRKIDPQGDIKVITESSHLFYYRPKLINYLAGEITPDKFTIYKEDYYQNKNIDIVRNEQAIKIKPEEKTLLCKSGNEYSYDRLLLATGARSFVPPISGAGKDGVFTLRGINDTDAILEYCRGKENVTVLGGGLLGLEVANSLLKLGKKVSVVEMADRLLPRQLDSDGAGLLQEILEKKGIQFYLSDLADEILGENAVNGIRLKSGREIVADVVIVSAGIRGRNELAIDAGIEINHGIIVNDYLETSIPGIYCAGDPVEHRGRLYGIWPAAKEQGKIAGMNMAGKEQKYLGTVFSSMLKVTDIDLFSAGDFLAEGTESLAFRDEYTYKKFLFRDDKPVGVIILGDSKAIRTASKVFEGRETIEELKKYF